MLTSGEIIQKYISFFVSKQHTYIKGESLVPQNDPTTLFTSSGMQPLVPYLLGETHPAGTRLVDVQNCFRAVDIEEVGDNRHTTFFRMLGNWSLGDYFKKEEIPWLFEFLTNKDTGLGLDPRKLYITVYAGDDVFKVEKDTESERIWQSLFKEKGIEAESIEYKTSEEPSIIGMKNARIFFYPGAANWWSRAGGPEKMPQGEIGGPDTEVFYEFTNIQHDAKFGKNCHPSCDCGRFMEIGNSVFMQYQKTAPGIRELITLKNKNVDFGGGLERLLSAVENQPDVFQTNLLRPIIATIKELTQMLYEENQRQMRIIADHLISSIFIIANNVKPSNKEQGYVLRRLLRRSFDNFYLLKGNDISPIIESIVEQYKQTDPYLVEQFEEIKDTILEEEQKYKSTRKQAVSFIEKKYKGKPLHDGDTREISADDAFVLYTTHGLSPTQIKSLGYVFNDQEFAQKMEAHQKLSRKGAEQKFRGGLADHQERTIMGHTATHLLHQALRDVLGNHVHQTGSNITTERVRFDFNYDKKLTNEEIKKVEDIVNEKINENLPVHFEIMPIEEAKKLGAIGLFMDTYGDKVKIYFIGPKKSGEKAYSIEFCGGPHVDFTEQLKSFKIIKQENLGANQKRLYAKVSE